MAATAYASGDVENDGLAYVQAAQALCVAFQRQADEGSIG